MIKALKERIRAENGAEAREKVLFLVKQLVITGLNALVGFMILRSLPKTGYAVYTIVFALLAVFTNITNVGITPALSGIGGKIWSDRSQMRALLNTALRLRNRLGWVFAGPFIVYCCWQFRETGLDWISVIALALLLLSAAWVQLQSALYAIVLQLNRAVRGLQRNELWFVLLKVGGIALLLFLQFNVLALVGWISLCLFLNFRANRQLADGFLTRHAESDPVFQREINQIVRSNLARTVYWSLEGQISILLCTLFASTENIAEIGALGRLSVYFTIFQSFIINYSLPRLARVQTKDGIRAQTKRIIVLTATLILPILIWAILHPASLMWVLGPNYSALQPYLLFYLLAVATGQMAAVVYQICAARAWIQMNRVYVPLALPLQIALIYFLDLSRISNVILFVGINNLFFLLFNLVMLYFAFIRYPSNPAAS